MAITKIKPKRITELAAYKGFVDELLLKDYFITIILYLLKDIKGIYFKGGTALQKIFLDYSRLSEDIDYTVTKDIQELKKEITTVVLNSGFFEKVTEDKQVNDFLRLVVHYTSFSNKKNLLFIDLNKRAKLIKKPEVHNLPHFYDEEIPKFSVKTLAKSEMFAEKLAATIGRNKPRDHFDIYMILKKGLELDYSIARQKCKTSGYEFNIQKMFNKAKKLHNKWEDDMIPLLNEIVDFKEVIKTLAKHFDLKKVKEENKEKNFLY